MSKEPTMSDEQVLSEPTKPESPVVNDQAAEQNANSGCGRKLSFGAVLLIIVCSALYGLQRWVVPSVDAEQTRPIEVAGRRDSGGDTEAGTPEFKLPPGAITAAISQTKIDQAEHPFDPLLEIARKSLIEIDEKIADYTCTLVTQVAIDGELQPEKYSQLKLRHRREVDGKQIPFSVYLNFLKPQSIVGQEVIWVEGENDDQLIAHLSGLMNVKRAYLLPEHPLAMKGNRYPIRKIGFRKLLERMIEIGEKDREHGECIVKLSRGVTINGVLCTVLQVEHPVPRDHFEYHLARIYIDDTRNIPVAYEGYTWPATPDVEPPLIERYFYIDVETNIGLTDADFDPDNDAYNYPSW